MKKTLIISLFILSCIQGFGQAKDTLKFDAKTVWYSSSYGRSQVNRMIYANFLSKYDIQTGRINILVSGATLYEGLLSGLYIPTTTTVAEKLAFLDSKITLSSVSQTIATLTTKMNASGTDTNIPSFFRSGFIQWINPTVGTVTLTCPTGSILLTGDAMNFLPFGNAQYGGFGIFLTGGATIKWSFNY